MDEDRLIGTMTCGCGWRLEVWSSAPPGVTDEVLEAHLLHHRLEALQGRQAAREASESNRPASSAGR